MPGPRYDDYQYRRQRELIPPTKEIARRRQLMAGTVTAIVVVAMVLGLVSLFGGGGDGG